jgi:hypothetical protein
MRDTAVYSKELFEEWFKPDFKAGNIHWKKSPVRSIPAGSIAGTPGSYGEIRIQLKNAEFVAHRVLWFMRHGENPKRIFHKNGNNADNRESNLISTKRREVVKVPLCKVEKVMTNDAIRKARKIVPRRDSMIWSMFGTGVAA